TPVSRSSLYKGFRDSWSAAGARKLLKSSSEHAGDIGVTSAGESRWGRRVIVPRQQAAATRARLVAVHPAWPSRATSPRACNQCNEMQRVGSAPPGGEEAAQRCFHLLGLGGGQLRLRRDRLESVGEANPGLALRHVQDAECQLGRDAQHVLTVI